MKMMIRPAKITHSMLLDLAKRAREDHERTIFYTIPGAAMAMSTTNTISASTKTATSIVPA